MKKAFSFLIVLLLMAISRSVFAYDFSAVAPTGQTLYYNISNEGTAIVTCPATESYSGYTKPTGNLTIPESVTYNGNIYSVTSISDYAFRDCWGITYVTIPNSVTSIGGLAFGNCIALTSVTIPDSVTSIGGLAFSGCSGLTSVAFNANRCSSVVYSDYYRAFYGCSNITTFTFGDSVTIIPDYLCYGLSALTSITIPNSVTSIGKYAFRDCSGLTSVTFNAERCTYAGSSGSNYSYPYPAFYGCSNITTFTFGDNVTKIPAYLCSGLSGLTSITIPNSVTSIGNHAFSDCSGLTAVYYSGTVANWCEIWFDEHSNPLSYAHQLYIDSVLVTSIVIPDVVLMINNYAFQGYSGLTSVTMGNSVYYIGNYAFQGCSGLTSVTMGNSVYYIGNSAFSGCSGLTSVTIGNSVTSIGNCAFSGCSGLTSVTIGNSVTSIGNSAFSGCSGLTSVTIPNSVTSIGNYAFSGCSGLTSVTIPNSVTIIGEWAFSGCSGLTSVTIPNSVTSIGNGAFYRVRHIEYYGSATGAPWGAISMNGVTDGDFVFSNSVKDTLLAYIGSGGMVTIPATVSLIGSYAFYECIGLTSVTIPDSVTTIGNYAFFNCSSLSLVTIPNSVTSIGDCTFANCSGLTSVTIGSSVTSIGYCAFNDCCNLTEVWLKPTIPPILGDSYSLGQDTVPIVVPRNSYNAYTNAGGNYTSHPIYRDSIIVTSYVNNPEWGYVTGGDTVFTYPYDTNAIIITATAIGIGHYHFVHWIDGNTDNPRQIVIESDTAFTAFFAIDTHTVSVSTNDIVRGMVSSSGTEFVYGTPCTVTATAYTGYTFAGWSNGVNANPYTFAVISDVELTALFVAEGEEVYTVTVTSADLTMGTASGGGQALDGGTVTIRAAGNPGYHFLRWNDNNTDSVRTIEVHGNVTYTAYFEANDVGIIDVDAINAKVYTSLGHIVVEGTEGNTVWLYDVNGRILATKQDEYSPLRFDVPASGTYLIKIGNHPARRIVVIR